MKVRVPVDIYIEAESAEAGRLIVSQTLENAALPNGEKIVFSTDDAEELSGACDECGYMIPDVDGGGTHNKWHNPSCSLYNENRE